MASNIGTKASRQAFGHIKMISAYTLVFNLGARIPQPNNHQCVPWKSEIEFWGTQTSQSEPISSCSLEVYGGYGRSMLSLAATAKALSRLDGLKRKL